MNLYKFSCFMYIILGGYMYFDRRILQVKMIKTVYITIRFDDFDLSAPKITVFHLGLLSF